MRKTLKAWVRSNRLEVENLHSVKDGLYIITIENEAESQTTRQRNYFFVLMECLNDYSDRGPGGQGKLEWYYEMCMRYGRFIDKKGDPVYKTLSQMSRDELRQFIESTLLYMTAEAGIENVPQPKDYGVSLR